MNDDEIYELYIERFSLTDTSFLFFGSVLLITFLLVFRNYWFTYRGHNIWDYLPSCNCLNNKKKASIGPAANVVKKEQVVKPKPQVGEADGPVPEGDIYSVDMPIMNPKHQREDGADEIPITLNALRQTDRIPDKEVETTVEKKA